ncbi:MAG: OmpA family protein [Bacteroidota bacterium]
MKKIVSLPILLGALMGVLISFQPTQAFAQADQDKDHPLISRYEGFKLKAKKEIELDRYRLPVGLAKSDKELGDVIQLEGKITRINYQYNQQPLPSLYQLYKNYEQALKGKGAEILFSCMREECGSRSKQTDPMITMSALGAMTTEYMRFGTHAMLIAKFSKDGKQYHTGVYIREEKNQMMYELHIIESDELTLDKVTVTDIEKGIEEDGKIAFYGIYFDFGKASLTSESNATLNQIATFLKNNPEKEFFVVGHTDNVGNYQSNLTLSEDRAQAVIDALGQRQVDISKLQSVGVGPVSPVSANNSDKKRAKNRRVELVLK